MAAFQSIFSFGVSYSDHVSFSFQVFALCLKFGILIFFVTKCESFKHVPKKISNIWVKWKQWSRKTCFVFTMVLPIEQQKSFFRSHMSCFWWYQVHHRQMGVSINGGTPIAGWFIRENPSLTWMRTGVALWLRKPPYVLWINHVTNVHFWWTFTPLFKCYLLRTKQRQFMMEPEMPKFWHHLSN